MIDIQEIKVGLKPIWPDLEIEWFESVSSTNTLAKEFSRAHPKQAKLFIAKEQTQGRGRYGKSFYSKLDHGLYMSVVIPIKDIDLPDVPMVTLAAATAISRAIDKELNLEVDIKWVNDIFYQGQKIVGILSETVHDMSQQRIQSVVIGLGLNVAGDFKQASPEVKEVAGSLFKNNIPEGVNINHLIVEYIRDLYDSINHLQARDFLTYYQSRMLGMNQMIYYQDHSGLQHGKMLGINNQGHLLVEKPNGSTESLYGQEIHLSSKQFRGRN